MSFWIKKYKIELEQLPIGLLLKSFFVVFLCVGILGSILLLLPIQDKIKGEVVIHTQGKPLTLNAPSSGWLHLMSEDQTIVEKGSVLATIHVEIDGESLEMLDQLVNQEIG